MRRRTVALLGTGALLAAGGVGLGIYLSRDTAPPPVELADCTIDAGLDVDGASADGRWETVAGDGTFVGYRIEEAFGGDTFLREIGGRTPAVEGTLELDGSTVASVDVTADVTQLASDQPRRDRYLATHGLETDAFPEAAFALTEPIELPVAPLPGKVFAVDVSGTLTLHGVEAPVTLATEACWHGATIDVAGSTPLLLADHDIVPPDVPGLARSEPDGILELQLTLEPVG